MRAEDINAIDAEAGVVATLIHHPEYSYFSEHLIPNHFTDWANQCVYTAICDLVRKGINRIDAYNIVEDLDSSDATKRYSEELTIDKLQELMEMSELIARHTLEEYNMLVSKVMNAALRRDTYKRLKECEALCYSNSDTDIGKQIYELIDDVISDFSVTDELPVFKDVVDDLWHDIEVRQDGQSFGFKFKFPTLNQYVMIEPGELVVVGAPAKGAKSMFLLNEAVDLLKQGKSVMYIDSELSSSLFLCRLISHLTGIEFNRVRNGWYSPEEKQEIDQSIVWIKQQDLVHVYMPIFDQQNIYASVKRTAHRFGKLDVLIVDYLKSTGDTDAYATYAEMGRLVDMIKNDIAGAMDIAALAAAQLNVNNKLADSAKIARNASTIMVLLDKTPEERATDGEECGNKKLMVQLNRNGMQHVQGEYIDINFDGNHVMMTEAKQHVPLEAY